VGIGEELVAAGAHGFAIHHGKIAELQRFAVGERPIIGDRLLDVR
jgi:hypothetical protein